LSPASDSVDRPWMPSTFLRPSSVRRGRSAKSADASPICKGSLNGEIMITTIEFPEGDRIYAPWRVVSNHENTGPNGERKIAMTTVLDGIVVEPMNGERETIALPEPIETVFEGATVDDIVNATTEAAQDTVQ
jgi:hypothetical protein